ncbi:MAG: DEAD/DEAH box helicase [Poseidonia sp.]
MSTFSELKLDDRLLEALNGEGYTTPTPVQAETIPALLDGRDVLGVAQTGTGKTAAFALPILHQLAAEPVDKPRPIRALMLTPTRELAAQIGDRLRVYGRHLPLFSTVIFGGVGQSPQVKALRRGVDLLVATPGRLLDLHDQGHVDLSRVEHFVLDEADRMLDMGFSNDVDRIQDLMPARRQNLLFSATMPDSIASLAGKMLYNPVRVDISPEEATTERIEQYVAFVQKQDKKALLIDLIEGQMVACGIVFTRTKHGANRLAKQLSKEGIPADSIHGDKSQTARTRALNDFRNGDVFILVATDIASRGIDVDDVTHVFNFDLPNEPEVYVHRIGRTARAGKEGLAYSFCDETESGYLVGIQRLLDTEIEVLEEQPYHFEKARPQPGQKPGRVKGFQGGGYAKRGTGRGSNMRRYDRGAPKRNQQQRRSTQPNRPQQASKPGDRRSSGRPQRGDGGPRNGSSRRPSNNRKPSGARSNQPRPGGRSGQPQGQGGGRPNRHRQQKRERR